MMSYETAKRLLDKDYASHGARGDMPPEKRMVAGACGGVFGWLSIYPLDVIRSRIFADTGGEGGGGKRYRSVLDCAAQTFREGGLRAFWKGFGFSMVRAAPVAGVVLPTFDWADRWLHDLNARHPGIL